MKESIEQIVCSLHGSLEQLPESESIELFICSYSDDATEFAQCLSGEEEMFSSYRGDYSESACSSRRKEFGNTMNRCSDWPKISVSQRFMDRDLTGGKRKRGMNSGINYWHLLLDKLFVSTNVSGKGLGLGYMSRDRQLHRNRTRIPNVIVTTNGVGTISDCSDSFCTEIDDFAPQFRAGSVASCVVSGSSGSRMKEYTDAAANILKVTAEKPTRKLPIGHRSGRNNLSAVDGPVAEIQVFGEWVENDHINMCRLFWFGGDSNPEPDGEIVFDGTVPGRDGGALSSTPAGGNSSGWIARFADETRDGPVETTSDGAAGPFHCTRAGGRDDDAGLGARGGDYPSAETENPASTPRDGPGKVVCGVSSDDMGPFWYAGEDTGERWDDRQRRPGSPLITTDLPRNSSSGQRRRSFLFNNPIVVGVQPISCRVLNVGHNLVRRTKEKTWDKRSKIFNRKTYVTL